MRKPPPGTEAITIEIPTKLAVRLRDFADKEMRSVKSLVVLAIQSYLDKYEDKGTVRTSVRVVLQSASETARASASEAGEAGAAETKAGRSRTRKNHPGSVP